MVDATGVDTRTVVEWFDLGGSLPLADNTPAEELVAAARSVQGLRELAERMGVPAGAPAPTLASAIDFVLDKLRTQARAHVLLFSSDLTLPYATLIDYYGLRFQLEFNFRDANQYWGLEDFMNVTATGVTISACARRARSR